MFDEEWFSVESQIALAGMYQRVRHLEGEVVEVGAWQGRSTACLANACYPEGVHVVDTWRGSPGEVSAELASRRDVYAEFMSNMAALTKGNFYTHQMDWREYFATHPDRVKLIHIDGCHAYDEVRGNIEAVRPMMADGGIICGDDNHHPPVQQAVMDTLGDAQLVATLWWVQV